MATCPYAEHAVYRDNSDCCVTSLPVLLASSKCIFHDAEELKVRTRDDFEEDEWLAPIFFLFLETAGKPEPIVFETHSCPAVDIFLVEDVWRDLWEMA